MGCFRSTKISEVLNQMLGSFLFSYLESENVLNAVGSNVIAIMVAKNSSTCKDMTLNELWRWTNVFRSLY